MSWANAFMVIAVLTTSAWLARRVSTAAAIALWTSAFLISAGMFLPSATLGGLLGPALLTTLTSAIASWPWAIGTVAHFISFLWLALVLWILRPDFRGWKVVAVLIVLATAGELLQGLTVDRSPRLEDVAVNLLGAGVGLILASLVMALWEWVKRMQAARPAG